MSRKALKYIEREKQREGERHREIEKERERQRDGERYRKAERGREAENENRDKYVCNIHCCLFNLLDFANKSFESAETSPLALYLPVSGPEPQTTIRRWT